MTLALSRRKPTKEEIAQAYGTSVPDIIAPGLNVLFCGINPGLYTAAVGHHFARPGNRFWPTLYAAGLTPRLLLPEEDHALLSWGYGLTNVVERATATADELTREELRTGGACLVRKVEQCAPRVLAVLGVTAYRSAFAQPQVTLGRQQARIGETLVWVLPNPSGLNAHYQLDDLARCFRALRG
jgi:TDG/mug DNA glycosylase family protein